MTWSSRSIPCIACTADPAPDIARDRVIVMELSVEVPLHSCHIGMERDGAVAHHAEDRTSSSNKRRGGSTTQLVRGNLCYGEDLEGEGGDYKCLRMGSFCNGDDDCSECHRVPIAPHWLSNGIPFKFIYLLTVFMFVWSALGALLLPTMWGLPLCVSVHTYGALFVPVCMHSY